VIGVAAPGWIGLWAIFSTSFFMSLVYPTIFVLGIDKLGRNTKINGSVLVMAIVGGAVLTLIMSLVSRIAKNIAIAYLVPLGGYFFVAFFAFWGFRIPPKMQVTRG
jgi:FHS family L-fucose permease-like MFS transporter